MVSSPSLYRCSASGEKTGSRSCFSGRRSASRQRRLSRPASTAIVSQRSATEELGTGLHRAVDLLVAVGERDEQRLELRRRDVDAALEQVAEERAVALRVARLRVAQIPHGAIGHE